MGNYIEELRQRLDWAERIVFFGGAGMSTESGIPDFRSNTGLFKTQRGSEHPPEEMLSHDFFIEHTEEFYRFYRHHMIYTEALPNAGHRALAELESRGSLKAVITQNIDGLHQLAGSRNVLELHGSVHRNFCMVCDTFYPLETVLAAEAVIPRCSACQGIIKPDVVLYQESLDLELFHRAEQYIAEADVLIVAGTSLSVYPAAGLIQHYKGDYLVLINKTPTRYDAFANYVIHEGIGGVLTALTER